MRLELQLSRVLTFDFEWLIAFEQLRCNVCTVDIERVNGNCTAGICG